MEWFYNIFGATLGLLAAAGIGVVVTSAVGFIAKWFETLRLALLRWAVRDEVVIEEVDQESLRVRHYWCLPKPERVRLAKRGEAGDRSRPRRAA